MAFYVFPFTSASVDSGSVGFQEVTLGRHKKLLVQASCAWSADVIYISLSVVKSSVFSHPLYCLAFAMKFFVIATACGIVSLSLLPSVIADDASTTVTLTYTAASSSGQTTANFYLVESDYGYCGMTIGGDEPTISEYV